MILNTVPAIIGELKLFPRISDGHGGTRWHCPTTKSQHQRFASATMKTGRLLPLSFLVFSSLAVHAAPSPSLDFGLEAADIAQTVFSQNPFSDELRSEASQWLDEAKELILRGKKNLDKWDHKGRQYIKQDSLLCAISFLVSIARVG